MRLGREQIAIALATLVALALAAPASAHPPTPISAGKRPITGKLHSWLHRAKVPLVRGRVQIVRRGCPRYSHLAACVYSSRPRRIYMKRGLPAARRVLYHELGHVFDLAVLHRRERRRFKRIMHLRRSGWFSGRRMPAEWFADGYSLCALGRRMHARGLYGYRPTRRQHRAVCRLIKRAAAPRGRKPQRPPRPPRVLSPEPPPPGPPQETPAPPPEECGWVEGLFGGCD
jgi:hypothetical protein